MCWISLDSVGSCVRNFWSRFPYLILPVVVLALLKAVAHSALLLLPLFFESCWRGYGVLVHTRIQRPMRLFFVQSNV